MSKNIQEDTKGDDPFPARTSSRCPAAYLNLIIHPVIIACSTRCITLPSVSGATGIRTLDPCLAKAVL